MHHRCSAAYVTEVAARSLQGLQGLPSYTFITSAAAIAGPGRAIEGSEVGAQNVPKQHSKTKCQALHRRSVAILSVLSYKGF
jgi:hypothetical protein